MSAALDLNSMARALGGEVSCGQVLAPAPGHGPKDRGMAVRPAPGAPGGVLVHLFNGGDPLEAKDHVRAACGLEPFSPTVDAAPVEFVYRDEHGQPYLRVTKAVKAGGVKAFYQSRWNGRAWEKGKPAGPKLPYRLPDILAGVNETVFVCEGEKDAEALAARGFVATSASEGAGKWTADLNRWFEGRTVYILPDNDQPGRDHAELVARNLAPVASDVRVVKLPGLTRQGADVSDWLEANDHAGLVDLCKAAPVWSSAGPKVTAATRGVTAAELFGMQFPAVEWTVDGLVTEGLTVFAGKPKIGKSWFCLGVALAVAVGGVALGGRVCTKGAVLYAALEDTKRRLRDRLEKVHGAFNRDPWPANLTFWTFGEMDRLADGGIDQLRAWIGENPDASLIMIDTFAKVRSGPQGKETAYEADYREVGSLKALADETGVAIVLVTHTRKMAADDPFDTVSGTLGITGAADTTMILARDGQGSTLHATGRDVAEVEAAVEFDPMDYAWRELGAASDVRRSDERTEVLAELLTADDGLTPSELAGMLNRKAGTLKVMLHRMAKAGEVRKGERRGSYLHPERAPAPEYPCNSRNPVTGAGHE